MELNLGNQVSDIIKRDGALLGLAGLTKQFLQSRTKGAANKLVNKINVKSLAKGLGYVELANAASTTLQELLPHVSEAADWSMALPFNVLNQTLGRIPGIGQIFRAIHNFVTKTVTTIADWVGLDGLAVTGSKLMLKDPNEGFETETDFKNPGKKYDYSGKGEDEMKKNNQPKTLTQVKERVVNHPSWYQNLDLHKEFSIPQGYTKTTLVNGSLATPKIVAHRLTENPMPDKDACIDRLNQKFSLIKAVRGLSKTDYSLIDLVNYERFAKMCLHIYYSIKRVVQAAKTYNLVQVKLGDNIISAMGYQPSEVRENLASYETLLCQFHRFISNNLPMSGDWIKKLAYIKEVIIPDYSDAKVATYHLFTLCMSSVFYDPTNPTAKFTFDEIPGSNGNSYSVVLGKLSDLEAAVANNLLWQQLIADYFGAFGSRAMWEDAAYPAYAQPINLASGDSDLNREQVKNAMYLNLKFPVITITEGKKNVKYIADLDDATPVQLKDYQFGNEFKADNATETALNYANIIDASCYTRLFRNYSFGAVGENGVKFLIPDINGVGAQTTSVGRGAFKYLTMMNHETPYTMHKNSYTEGEALEISQLKVRSIGAKLECGAASFESYFLFKTFEYAIMESTVFVYHNNGAVTEDATYVLCNEAISDDDLQDVESAVDYPDEIMAWALIDWMPFMHVTFFGYDSEDTTYYPRDVLLCDFDAFGSLDDRAFCTAINYTTYSLLGAGITVSSKGKRVDNLGAVYKDKANRRG